MNQNTEKNYSRSSRSRTSTSIYPGNGHHSSLELVAPPRSLQFDIGRPASSHKTHSPSIISPASPNPASCLSTPSTQYSSTYNLPPRGQQNSDKSQPRLHHHQQQQQYQHNVQQLDTPTFLIHPAPDNSAPTSALTSTKTSATMRYINQHNYRFLLWLMLPPS
jgi:hypothetical protein